VLLANRRLPFMFAATQRKKGRGALRTEGMLQTWIHMLWLPWLQKPPSFGCQENINQPLIWNIVCSSLSKEP
jgi:hypothetical protein